MASDRASEHESLRVGCGLAWGGAGAGLTGLCNAWVRVWKRRASKSEGGCVRAQAPFLGTAQLLKLE